MKKTALDTLEEYCMQAYKDKKNIYIEIRLPLFSESEYIINKHKNILEKLAYYKAHFNENLECIDNKEIEIIAFGTIHPSNMPKDMEI